HRARLQRVRGACARCGRRAPATPRHRAQRDGRPRALALLHRTPQRPSHLRHGDKQARRHRRARRGAQTDMTITKATPHGTQNEALVFERSQKGRRGYRLPALDVEETPLDELLPADLRRDDDLEGLPELSEPDVVRHFTRISTWNYNIDLGLYPLG